MRHLQVIEAEKDKLEKQIATMQDERHSALYQAPSGKVAPGIRTFLWLLIAAFLALVFGYTATSTKSPAVFAAVIALVFIVLALMAVGRFLSGRKSMAASIVFFILSGAVLAVSGVAISYLSQGKSLLLTVFPEWIKEFKNVKLDSFYYCDVVLILISGIMAFGTLVKIIQEVVKKSQASKKSADYDVKIKEAQSSLTEVSDEYDCTKKELKEKCLRELCKPQPDVKQMEELGSYGWEQATKWVQDKKRSDRLANAKSIYENAMNNEKPDIKALEEAAELGDPNANMWLAKNKTVDFFANMQDYATEEYRDYFEKVTKHISQAEGCQDGTEYELVRIIAYDIMCAHGGDLKKLPSKDDNMKAIGMLREMKRSDTVKGDERTFVERALSVLVETMDALAQSEKEEKEARRRERESTVSSAPTIRPCRYDACGICTKKSTSYTKINCFYSPGYDQLGCPDRR